MIKVLLADDEPIIIKGLKKLVNWGEMGMSIAGEATDGYRLWKLVQELQPEIVVSDICMPKMTGLEFMEELNHSGYQTKVVFISGYQKFSYAQEAIRLGAVEYLLKPVQKTALENALMKAANQLSDHKKLSIFQEKKSSLQQFFHKMNEGNEYAEQDLYNSFEQLGIDYRGKLFCGVCVSFTEECRKTMQTEFYEKSELINFSALNKVQNVFKVNRRGFVIRRENECMDLLCIVKPEESASFTENVIWPVKKEIEQEHPVHLQIGVGEFSGDPMSLSYVYKSARFAYKMRYFRQEEVICSGQIHRCFTYSFEDYQKMYQMILDGILKKEPDSIGLFEKCFEIIKNLHYGNKYAVINRIILFTGDLYNSLVEYRLLHREDWSCQEQFMETARCQDSIQGLKRAFLSHYQKILDKIYEDVKVWDNPVIAEIKEYICVHYGENINMDQLAQIACVSPLYFSSFFKRATGQNFKNFLTDIRMKEAQKLIMTTDMKSYEIAERVGYNNIRQFNSKFREYFGESPGDYKKRLLGK